MLPMIITRSEDFTTISAPVTWYRGYKIEQWNNQITVYDMSGNRPKIVYGEYIRRDGKSGWDLCKEYLDKNLMYSTMNNTFQSEYDWFVKTMKSHQNSQV